MAKRSFNMLEIEKKFLLVNDSWKYNIEKTMLLEQVYFIEDNIKKRVRIIDKTIAIKGYKGESVLVNGFLEREEIENEISLEEGLKYFHESDRILVKNRNILNIGLRDSEGKFFPYEIDEFLNLNSPLTLAEIEISKKIF